MDNKSSQYELVKPQEISDADLKHLETELKKLATPLLKKPENFGNFRIAALGDTLFPKPLSPGVKEQNPRLLKWLFFVDDQDKSTREIGYYYSPKTKKLYTIKNEGNVEYKSIDDAVSDFNQEVNNLKQQFEDH